MPAGNGLAKIVAARGIAASPQLQGLLRRRLDYYYYYYYSSSYYYYYHRVYSPSSCSACPSPLNTKKTASAREAAAVVSSGEHCGCNPLRRHRLFLAPTSAGHVTPDRSEIPNEERKLPGNSAAQPFHNPQHSYSAVILPCWKMDSDMTKLQQHLVEIEKEAERLLLSRHQMVENDKHRNGNREALTALRKKARTTRSSVPSPFEPIMKDIVEAEPRPLIKEVCPTCGHHDSRESTWLMFSGSDIFARVPFHAAHTVLEKDQEWLDLEMKKLQSYVKEQSLVISEKGALADNISPGIVRSLVRLTDKQ